MAERRVRVGSRDLALSTFRFTKKDLDAAPPAQKSFHLLLGQTCNEVMILQSILMQALNGTKTGSQPEKEVALGTVFLMARLLSGRLYESHLLLNKKENGRLLQEMWDACPMRPGDEEYRTESETARDSINKYFGSSDALLRRVRNKLAFHIDQAAIDSSYSRMPDDIQLVDFHTASRGSTFFGCADTVTALAVGELLEIEPGVALNKLMDDVTELSGALVDFAYGYMLGFCRTYLGRDKFAYNSIVLRDVPALDRHKLTFFMRPPRKVPTARQSS